ncbi:MAG: hypothetical protein GX387_14600 [Clostridium sp.]|nr:hypothetical protein [Clostridium sp.]HHX18637.1 hypothetical protein [Clostridium sp.]
MKIEIVYASMTKHTRKLAEALASYLGIIAQDVKSNPVLDQCDLLLLGSGVYGGKLAPEIEEFANKLSQANVKKVILFTTSCAGKDITMKLQDVLKEKGILVYDKAYTCPGQFLIFKIKRPNKNDVTSFIQFAKQAIESLK